jgi:DnaJ family protein B protein 4
MSSYAVLGIAPNATDDEVRSAYKRKALECHPDRHVKGKDVATQNFIEVHAAYRAILSERERKAAMAQPSTSTDKRSSSVPPSMSANDTNPSSEAGPSGSSMPFSSSSTHSFKAPYSSSSSTPLSSPASSPFSTPASSPYSTPASSPASSMTSLPEERSSNFSSRQPKMSATCEEVDDDEDDASSICSSTSSHTTESPPEAGPSQAGASPLEPRAKLRKRQPKQKQKAKRDPSTSSDNYKCHHTYPEPAYSSSSKKPHGDGSSTPHDRPNKHPRRHKHNTKQNETELKDYYDCLPSLKDYPKADLPVEWTCPLSLTLEDVFHGRRLCYRITRRYLSGKTKGVVLDVDIPAGCRPGTKIVFRDAGHERRDGTRQDLVFIVQEEKHERFVRGREWDGGGRDGGDDQHKDTGNNGHGHGKEEEEDRQRDRSRGKDKDGTKHRGRRNHQFREEDLVMEVRLPWVDRLKEEKAKVVVAGIDGKELVFEVDCRAGKADSKEKDGEKITGVGVIDNAGMPARAKGTAGGAKAVGADESGKRGRLVIRWEIFTPIPSSTSKWEAFKQIFTFGK